MSAAAGGAVRVAAEPAPPPWLRGAVRGVLERAPGYAEMDAPSRTALARAMVQVSALAAELIAQESAAQDDIDRQQPGARAAPLARAQAQPEFGAATDRLASTTSAVLGAVSFPRFVTDLVNGVFKAMLESTSQQMQMYVELLNSVSTSLEGFEKSQSSPAQIRQWVADRFPEQIEYDTPELEPGETADPEDVADVKLRLRSGASMPDVEQIRGTLGLGPDEKLEVSEPEQLVPLARRLLARQRQQMLATMVMLGMQRIVIDSGRISASMRFHIDTRSAASEDKGSQFGLQNRAKASGSFGAGPWGVKAEVENTISYVTTQRSQATEEINTDLELNSSVELNFRTDYLPLNRMAAQAQADRVRKASLNPSAEGGGETPADRRARLDAQLRAEESRRSGLLTMPTEPAAKPEPAKPATDKAADKPAEKPATDKPKTETADKKPAAPADKATAKPDANAKKPADTKAAPVAAGKLTK